MNFKSVLFIALGCGLSAASHSLELRGDLAPFVEGGVSTERLEYHLMALILLLGALGFFIAAGVSVFRRLRG